MIGDRIKQARMASGLSLRALAEKVGVSAMAISKYERDESVPSSGVLLSLAKALGVRTEYFFRRVVIELTKDDVKHRDQHLLPEKEELKVLADVKEQLERWYELDAFLPIPWFVPFTLPSEFSHKKISDFDDIEDIAIDMRKHWDLGLNPVPDLIDSFESKGIKVLTTKYDGHKNFNGLSAQVNGSPVIVLGSGEQWAGDRQRFTLAHELGHLVLEDLLDDTLKNDEEKACHRFAGAFLAPKDAVYKAFGQKRKKIELQELYILKHEYGLSMQAWSYRLKDLKIITQSTHSELWKNHMRHWKKAEKEPGDQCSKEKDRLFNQLVFRALAEDLIGESKAAELLGKTVSALHLCRKMECPSDVAD